MSLEQRLHTAERGTESISKGGISRRAFLKASAVAGGGLLLSFRLPALMRNAEAAGIPTANIFAPNAFIRIDRQGRVTLVVHQVEMGQGTYTSLADAPRRRAGSGFGPGPARTCAARR